MEFSFAISRGDPCPEFSFSFKCFNRHIHLSFPQKTRKTPAAARRGLSLWVSMKFYIICVYCFSAFPCYEIFYTHINLRLPELLIQIQSVEAA